MFFFLKKHIAQGINTGRTCEIGEMTEDNILDTDRKSSYYCVFYPDMSKTYQSENNFFEFTRDMKIRKIDITLQWLQYNGYVVMAAIVFASSLAYVYKVSVS